MQQQRTKTVLIVFAIVEFIVIAGAVLSVALFFLGRFSAPRQLAETISSTKSIAVLPRVIWPVAEVKTRLTVCTAQLPLLFFPTWGGTPYFSARSFSSTCERVSQTAHAAFRR